MTKNRLNETRDNDDADEELLDSANALALRPPAIKTMAGVVTDAGSVHQTPPPPPQPLP